MSAMRLPKNQRPSVADQRHVMGSFGESALASLTLVKVFVRYTRASRILLAAEVRLQCCRSLTHMWW